MFDYEFKAKICDIRRWCETNGFHCYVSPRDDYKFQGMPHISFEPCQIAPPSDFVAHVPEATIISGDCKGSYYYYVLAQDHTLFVDGLNIHPRHHLGRADSFAKKLITDLEVQIDLSEFENKGSLPGEHVLIGGMTNYYHWLFEYLPRIGTYRDSRPKVENYLINGDLSNLQRDTLKFLGVSLSKCSPLMRRSFLQVNRLCVPSIKNVPEAIKFLRNNFLTKGRPDVPRRIYISREDTLEQRINHPSVIEDILKGFDFKKVILSTMNIGEQVQLFSSAELIVGAHGAGLTNIVFCGNSARVIEIVNSTNTEYTFFSSIASNLGFHFEKHVDFTNSVDSDFESKKDIFVKLINSLL